MSGSLISFLPQLLPRLAGDALNIAQAQRDVLSFHSTEENPKVSSKLPSGKAQVENSLVENLKNRIERSVPYSFSEFSSRSVPVTRRVLAAQLLPADLGTVNVTQINDYVMALCGVSNVSGERALELGLYTCAQELRGLPYQTGYLPVARSVLSSLAGGSEDAVIQSLARFAYEDSMGEFCSPSDSRVNSLKQLLGVEAEVADCSDEASQDFGVYQEPVLQDAFIEQSLQSPLRAFNHKAIQAG